MTSWDRMRAYARQRRQDPLGQATFTARQARRYEKKWKREFLKRQVKESEMADDTTKQGPQTQPQPKQGPQTRPLPPQGPQRQPGSPRR